VNEPSAEVVVSSVHSEEQLRRVYGFAATVLGLADETKHTLAYYQAQLGVAPGLLVFAGTATGTVCGSMLSSIEGDHVLVGPVAVDPARRRQGIGRAMMQRLEEQARQLGQRTLILGSRREAEAFYLSCGFQPNLFVQLAEPDALPRLRGLRRSYEVAWSAAQGGYAKLMLRTPTVDRSLEDEYRRQFPACATQYVFIKHLA